jgi:HlyD family secretion protein
MKKKKVTKIVIIGVVALAVLLAVLKKTGVFGGKEVEKVSTELAQKRTIIETVSASGKIQPELEVKISPDVSGEVVELYVKEGDKVKKGDLLAKIKPDIYESSYEQMVATMNSQKANEANAKARLAQVKAQFINAKSTYERNETLYKQNAISQSEYDAAKAAYEVAKEAVAAAEEAYKGAQYQAQSTGASVKQAKENLSKTSVVSPVDGTISKLSVEKGERVVGTTQFAGTEIMRIANLTEMEVLVSVNENDIVKVSLNDTALIEVDAYLNRKFRGVVTEIANSANVNGLSADQVTNFDVKVRLLSESYSDLINPKYPNLSPFRPGMSATVDIQTETQFNVLTVPIQSVTTREDTSAKKKIEAKTEEEPPPPGQGDDSKNGAVREKQVLAENEYIFVFENGTVKMQKVKTGIQDNTNIQILEGIKDGQEVVAAPYSAITKKLKDGDAVKKVDKKNLFEEKK